MGKVFVQVTAEHDINGKIRPLTVKWEDGRIFKIDRLLDVRQAASLKGRAWGCGILAGSIVNKCIYFVTKVSGL